MTRCMQSRRRTSIELESLERRRLLVLTLAGGECQVPSYTSGWQTEPSVAVDADGDFVVVWHSNDPGVRGGIFARRFDASGEPLTGEVRVNVDTSTSNPDVAAGADGTFIVTWSGSIGGSSVQNVYARRFNSSAEPLDGEVRVDQHTAIFLRRPDVAMDQAGNFVITWDSYLGAGPSTEVFARRYGATGAPLGDEFRVNQAGSFEQRDPTIALDADGDFVIAWRDDAYYAHTSGENHITARRYTASGVPQGGEFRVDAFTTGLQAAPSVAMDSDGDFIVVWQTSAEGASRIMARRFGAAGEPRGQFQVNILTLDNNQPSVASQADGGFVVSWTSGNSAELSVLARMYTAEGVATGAPVQINTFEPREQTDSDVAINDHGHVVVAWR